MNLRQIYDKLKQQAERNGHQIDEGRLTQQAWMMRDRMMFEQSFASNTVSSSSAAGAGGGSGLRRRQPVVDVNIVQSTLYYEFNNDKLSYFVYNFETKKLSDIILISSNVYSIDNSFVLTGVGYGFRIETVDSTEVIYINNDGVIVWKDSVDSYENDYIEGKYMIVKYRKGTSYFLSILDYLGKHRIIEIDQSTEFIGTFNSGFTLRLNDDYFILKDGSGELVSLGEGDFVTNQNSNKIINISGDIMVYNIDGVLVGSYIREDSIDDYYFLENGSFFIIFRTSSSEIKVLFFSGVSNTFSERIFPNLNYDVDRGDQRSSTSSRNRLAEGAGAIYLYNQSVEYILPIWSTDEQIREAYEVNNINIIDGLDDSNFTITRSKDFINVLIIDNNSGEFYSILRFNRVGTSFDILTTEVESDWELRDDDQINGKTILEFRKEEDGIFGFDDLSNLSERRFVSFYDANNGAIGNNVIDQEFIMKEVTTNRYWKVIFMQWTQNNNGGGFSYQRTEINELGVEIGPLVEFTKTNYGNEVDIIIEGVLEIKRGNNGPIYNSATEISSNASISPQGTIWNSRLAYGRIRKVSIIGLDGNEIDSIIANDSGYDNSYRGSTYIFITDEGNKTWISNDANGKKFTELDKYYDNYVSPSNYITETGIRLGNYVLYNSGELENIIITPNSISKEFSPITSEYDFFKVDSRYIFENGFLLICSGVKSAGGEFIIVEYYNLNGDLIFRKELELFRLFDGTFNIVDQIGKRSSIIWSYEDNIKNIIFFKGDSVFEFNTELTGDVSYLINDYNWWD